MATAPAPLPEVGGESSSRDVGSSLDEALRDAVETLESSAYQDGNPAFSPLTARDWSIMAAAYVVVPIVFALVVWLA